MMSVGRYHEYTGVFSTVEFPYKFNCFPDNLPTFVMISPGAMNTPQCTHDISHSTRDIPPVYCTPPRCTAQTFWLSARKNLGGGSKKQQTIVFQNNRLLFLLFFLLLFENFRGSKRFLGEAKVVLGGAPLRPPVAESYHYAGWLLGPTKT